VLHIVDDVDGVQGVDDVQGVDGVARVAFNFDWMPEGVLAVHSYVRIRPSHMIIVYDYPFTGTISVAFYERSYCIRQALLIMVTDNHWQWLPWPKMISELCSCFFLLLLSGWCW